MSNQKAYASDVSLSFGGLVNLVVDLVPAKATQKAEETTKLTIICPDCNEPTKGEQRYVCPNDSAHGPYTSGEMARAKEIDKVLYPISADKIVELKEPTLPPGEMTVRAFPASEIEPITLPAGSSYRLRPKGQVNLYAMLMDLIGKSPNRAFVGELTVRNIQKMYRLTSFNGQLILQELIRPDEMAEVDEIKGTHDPKLYATLETFLDAQEEDNFDATEFHNKLKERAIALAAELENEDGTAKPKKKAPKPKSSDDNLLGALEAAIKATPKKTKKAS